MIVNINKNVSAKGLKSVLQYHQNKIDKGLGELMFNNLDLSLKMDPKSLYSSLENFMKIHSPKSSSQRYHHLDIDFAKEDNISIDKKLAAIEDWKVVMGYADTKHILIRHLDKGYDHYHLVASSATVNGNKIDSYKDHDRNNLTCRAIEKRYGLRVLSEKGIGKTYEKSDKYTMARALGKLPSENKKESVFQPILAYDYYSKLNNDQIKYRFQKVNSGVELYKKATARLYELGLYERSQKTQLFKIVEASLAIATNIDTLLLELRKHGAYGRYLGKDKLMFGLPDKPFYIDSKKLNKRFSILELNKFFRRKRNIHRRRDPSEDMDMDF